MAHKMISITIDGKRVEVPEGMNLIEAAEVAGIHIPNLCYIKGMRPVGACRLCFVEIEGTKGPQIACNTKVKEGMVINTDTEHLREMRRFVIDLILSMHPLDCMTCTKAGVCDLQRYAYEFEIKESSFTRKKFGFTPDDANPFIKRDPDYCILCGKCVRICKEQDTNVLGFMGRGVGSKVTTAMDRPLQESGCTFCGSCIDVCPVNAILEADRWRKGREWDYDIKSSICLLCGNACDINVSTMDGNIMKINAGAPQGSVTNYICAYGRFGYDAVESHSRVKVPLLKENGVFKEITWDEALKIVSERLKKAGKDTGFIATGRLLNEDAIALRDFAQKVVKTKNIDTTVSLYGDKETLINRADIDGADLFVVIDLNPSQWRRVLPALDAMLRRSLKRGVKVININKEETSLGKIATVNITGDEISNLKALIRAMVDKGLKIDPKLLKEVSDSTVTESVEKAASIYMDSKNPVILTSCSIYPAASNLELIKGKVVSVPYESNAKGVVLMGLVPDKTGYTEMIQGGLKVLYLIGDVHLNKRPLVDFIIVQHSHLNGIAKEADLVIPVPDYLEEEGTIVDYLGRLRKVTKVKEPPTGVVSHKEVFTSIARLLKARLNPVKDARIKRLASFKVKVSPRPFKKLDKPDIDHFEFIKSLNASVIKNSRLNWLVDREVVTV